LHRSIFKLQYILFAGLISVGAHQYNEKKLSEIRKLDYFDELSLSIITYYEILRGLKYIGNKRELGDFENLMDNSELITLDREIIKKASDIYVGLKEKGELIGDADILIAASCLLKNMVLVTDDEKHFRRIKELEVENWLLRL
jgi:tRNA(fMet)-specific endonuclease VapC